MSCSSKCASKLHGQFEAMLKRCRLGKKQPTEHLNLETPASLLQMFACAGMLHTTVEFACATLEQWDIIWSLSKCCNEQLRNIKETLFTMGALFLYPLSFEIIHQYRTCFTQVESERSLCFDGAVLIKNMNLWKNNISGKKVLRSCYTHRFDKFSFVGIPRTFIRVGDSEKEGFYIAYDKDEKFALCVYGKEYNDEDWRELSPLYAQFYELTLEDGSCMTIDAFWGTPWRQYNVFLAPSLDRHVYPFHLHTAYSADHNFNVYVTGKYISYLERWKPELWPSHARVGCMQWTEVADEGRIRLIG
jgi:hypothetical protein